ncbi:MAG: hypothetical protein COV10_04185 [Candidatus Vogelbacteria bacterium CG10_big_fil_rev_8_21_14_0_10_51_16]|uniref:Uncharacterized protein n=1 Tax=Candidatus Vogelbacteria bacterium CG10_big_fil_rev_8_21_14_0_10_51_16 TaxID=1975045 RepID=A0A2H0RDC3_9BACT|nr:MAG: hypothetical protein COV10_04185 [Candidatus Vogelbacteria bacterium CG10_big_fil_rev_8_21_14_0_10_51_16]
MGVIHSFLRQKKWPQAQALGPKRGGVGGGPHWVGGRGPPGTRDWYQSPETLELVERPWRLASPAPKKELASAPSESILRIYD